MKVTSAARLFPLMALFLSVSFACGTGAASTEAPEATEVAAQPDAATEPAVAAAQEFFTEEFEGDTSNWSYFYVDGTKPVPVRADSEFGTMTVGADGGALVFDLQSDGQWVYTTYDPVVYENVRVDVKAENRGVNNNNVSLICRYGDEGWYEFNVANNGLFWIYHALVVAPDNRVIYSLLADGGSNKIKSGKEVNEYAIVCEDRTLTLYINGFETRTLEENKYVLRDGLIGLSVSSFDNLPVQVEFDWVKISAP